MTRRERIEEYLKKKNPDRNVAVVGYGEIGGGYSRQMAWFEIEVDGERRKLVWRGDPPSDQQIVVTDRAREFAVISALPESAGAPRAHYFDADGSEMGAVSVILDFVEGDQLIGVLRSTPQAQWPGLVDSVAELAAGIHKTREIPEALEQPASWDAHVDACIAAWRHLEQIQVEPAPLLRYVTGWLDTNRPPEVPLTLIHGDLQSPNIIIGADGVNAIDWEFARVGDPREDLGWFTAMAAITPPDPIAGDLSRLCAAYRDASGLSDEQINPATVAYFTILPFGPMVGQFSGQVAELVAGRNRSLKTANLAYVVTAMLEGWVGLIGTLEQGKAAAPA